MDLIGREGGIFRYQGRELALRTINVGFKRDTITLDRGSFGFWKDGTWIPMEQKAHIEKLIVEELEESGLDVIIEREYPAQSV